MARDKQKQYPWFKMHSKGWLTGTIRATMTIEERSIWADLLAMANESRVRGVICRAEGIPYDREYIANYLDVPVELLNRTIEICRTDKNIFNELHRIEIDDAGCIHVINWEYYQARTDGKEDKKDDKIPMSPEDEEARQQATSAKYSYLQPGAAKRGIQHREFEEAVKQHNKNLRQGGD